MASQKGNTKLYNDISKFQTDAINNYIAPVILAPFNLLLLITNYFVLGFIFTSYLVYIVLKSTIKGFFALIVMLLDGFVYSSFLFFKFIVSPIINIPEYIYKLLPIDRINQKLHDREQARKEHEKLKEEERREREKLIRENRLEEEARKKRLNDVYLNEKVDYKIDSFGDKIVYYLNHLNQIPKDLAKMFVDTYNNLSIVKIIKGSSHIDREVLLIDFEGEDAEKSPTKLMYEYIGKNDDGKVTKGYFPAFSKVEVHSFLLSEGFEVYSIRTNKWINLLHGGEKSASGKIKTKDLIFFLNQLSTYIKSGIPLVDSLKILSKQYKNPTYKRIFRALIYELTMGSSFSEAMIKQQNAFPKLLINMSKSAELTGELPEALDDMAEYYTETEKTKKQMITALMYPSIIFVISIAVITFIMVFVIPKFVDIYSSMDSSEIPAFTKFVIDASDFMQEYLVFLFIGIIAFILVVKYLHKNVKVIRSIMQSMMMHTPVIGNVIIYNEVTMFTKTFSSLLKHNVFITDSMEILNRITNNEIYKMLVMDTISNLAKGEKISTAFKGHWAFPIPAYEMLVTGEKTGQLAEMMEKVASYYQEQHKNSVTRIKTFVEPILIIFLTAVVGAIILSIIIPMFNMYETIQS